MAVAAPPTLLCALCGLTAHRPLTGDVNGQTHTFCCVGCRQVYQVLMESHALDGGQDPTQTTLYQQCLQMGLIARPEAAFPMGGVAEAAGGASPAPPLLGFGGPSAPTLPQSAFGGPSDTLDATREAAFQVGGMWCAACAWLIEAALQKTKGVTGARVFFASDVVKVTYKPARTGPEELLAAVRKLGYTAENYADGGPQNGTRAIERRASLVRAVVAIIFAMNVGMFSLALYTSYFRHAAPQFGMAAGDGHILTAWSLALSLPVLWAGWPLFRRAWEAARQGAAVMETLIALGSGTAFLYSLWVMARGGTHVYFETADMLVALTLVGKHLETGARSEAGGAIALLYGLLPQKAVVLSPEGRETLVAVAKLGVGDRVLVRPGERVPADGTVVIGMALVDESLLTGEARPVSKTPGDTVTGGTVATDAPLTVSVSRVGDESTLAQMIALVEAALSAKSPAERWTDKISRVFVPIIIALALATAGILWLNHAPANTLLVRAVSVLVIACPCALGLATPLAITTGVGLAARRGILIGNTQVLEVLPRVRHLLVDKTGTLTEGRFAVRETVYAERGRPEDWAVIAVLETASEHPLARALVSFAREQAAPRPPILGELEVINFARHVGQGVTGIVNDGHWFVGNAALCAAQGASVPPHLLARAETWQAQGWTSLFYGAAGEVRGAVALGDALRPGAQEAINTLARLGITTEVVSGDARGTTEAIARTVGIAQVTAQMTPMDKAARVRSAQDGSNTPPRLRHPSLLPAAEALRAGPFGNGEGPIKLSPAVSHPLSFIKWPRAKPQEKMPTAPLHSYGEGWRSRGGARTTVAMAGDGINDAPALAQADVGIAFGSGTEIARRAADITLVGDDIGKLADLFTVSRATARVMRQNLFWACAYNGVCIPLAIAGLVNPLVAASAMLVSSLSVVFNTRRLRRTLNTGNG